MKREEKSKKIVPISQSFWPLFFTSLVVDRFIGESVAIALVDKRRRKIVVIVYPFLRSDGSYRAPELQKIVDCFNPKVEWRARPFLAPRQLPFSVEEIASIEEFYLYEVRANSFDYLVLVPALETHQALKANLFYLAFDNVNADYHELIPGAETVYRHYDSRNRSLRVIYYFPEGGSIRYGRDQHSFLASAHQFGGSNVIPFEKKRRHES